MDFQNIYNGTKSTNKTKKTRRSSSMWLMMVNDWLLTPINLNKEIFVDICLVCAASGKLFEKKKY